MSRISETDALSHATLARSLERRSIRPDGLFRLAYVIRRSPVIGEASPEGRALSSCTLSSASLDRNPKSAAKLYVRGLAKWRNDDTRGGDTDIAAATALDAKIPDTYAKFPGMQQLDRNAHAAAKSAKS